MYNENTSCCCKRLFSYFAKDPILPTNNMSFNINFIFWYLCLGKYHAPNATKNTNGNVFSAKFRASLDTLIVYLLHIPSYRWHEFLSLERLFVTLGYSFDRFHMRLWLLCWFHCYSDQEVYCGIHSGKTLSINRPLDVNISCFVCNWTFFSLIH